MITIGVVVPVLNQFKMAVDALWSIKSSYTWQPYIIPNYRYNLGLAQSWNMGVEMAEQDGHDLALIINDDILFSPDAVDIMAEPLIRHDDSQIVMTTGTNMRGGMNPDDILTFFRDDAPPRDNPDFSCFMIPTDIHHIIGTFDENFRPAYFEDNDYHRRIELLGYRAVCLDGAPYYHYGSQTQNANQNIPVVPPFAFLNNKTYYMNKWGGEPGTERFTNPFNDPNRSPKDW